MPALIASSWLHLTASRTSFQELKSLDTISRTNRDNDAHFWTCCLLEGIHGVALSDKSSMRN